MYVGSLLNFTLVSFVQAIPASKNKFRSENRNLEGTAANFLGPVNGKRTSKLKTAILLPVN
ncbi:hypothetical protein D3C86_1934490 [compost metagenome]